MLINKRYLDLVEKLQRQFPGRFSSFRYVNPNSIIATWRTPPTAQEQTDYNTTVTSHDWRPRRPKPRPEVLSQVQSLDILQFRALMNHVATDWLLEHPIKARLAGIEVEDLA